MNELKVLNNIQGRIEWDSEAAKSYIVSIIAPYRGLVVTDDNVKDMEKTQKELASMRRKIDKFRKDTKKQAEEPIKAFEMEIKDIQKVIADAEEPIAEQLEKYELKRVNNVRSAIMAEAKEVAIHESLRDEYMVDFVIDQSWTNRTAKKAFVSQGILAKITELKRVQDLDDQQKQMEILKNKQIAMLCTNLSEKYGLNTPVEPSQLYYQTKDAELTDLIPIVEKAVQAQAEVERNIMQAMVAASKPEIDKEPVKVQALEDPTIHTVTLRLLDVSEEQLECLKTHSVIGGMKYEIVEVR